MSFFNTEECGLYKLGGIKAHGLELGETLSAIHDWQKGRKLSETLPWDEKHNSKNIANCYLRDIHFDKQTGDYLLVLWKSSTNTGKMLGASEDDAVGEGTAVKQRDKIKGKKIIWGHPCYYWIIPDKNLIVSIKFNHSLCDAEMFREYLVKCINNKIPLPLKVKEFNEDGSKNDYHRIYFKDEDVKLYYKFSMKLKHLKTTYQELEKNYNKISSIIVRETISVKTRNSRKDLSKWMNHITGKVGRSIPLGENKDKKDKRRIEVSIEAQPTLEEVKKIVENNQHDGDTWDDIGFGIKGQTDIFVSKCRLTDKVVIMGSKDSEIKAKRLYNKIKEERNNFIRKASE